MSEDTKWDNPETIVDKNSDEVRKFHKEMREKVEKEYTPQEAELLKERMSVINEKFMEGELQCPDKVYVDLGLLKDINLGILFAMIYKRPTAQEDYLYIKENLKDYQIRTFDDPLYYFPELNITQEEFDNFFNDKRNHTLIYTLAPSTVFYYILKDNLRKNSQHAHMKHKYVDRPIPGKDGQFIRDFTDVTYFVNTHPLRLSDFHKTKLQRLLADSLGIGVTVMDIPIETIPVDAILAMDELNLYKLTRFLDNKDINKALSDEKFIGKHIFAPLLFTRDARHIVEEHEKEDPKHFYREKSKIEAVMSIYSYFKWLEAARYCIDITLFKKDGEDDDKDREAEIPTL